jgi:hypothetical protein
LAGTGQAIAERLSGGIVGTGVARELTPNAIPT